MVLDQRLMKNLHRHEDILTYGYKDSYKCILRLEQIMSKLFKIFLLALTLLGDATVMANTQEAELMDVFAERRQERVRLNAQRFIRKDGGSFWNSVKFIPYLTMTWAGQRLVQHEIFTMATDFFHELGHYVAAKALGFQIQHFTLKTKLYGQPDVPLYTTKIFGDTFQLIGATKNDISGGRTRVALPKDQSIVAINLKIIFMTVAGPVMNCVMALGFTALAAMWIGKPQTSPVISEIIPGSPLSEAKLLPGDRVVAINDGQVETAEEVVHYIAKAGSQFTIRVRRGDTVFQTKVQRGTAKINPWSLSFLKHWMFDIGLADEAQHLGMHFSQRHFKKLGAGEAIKFAFAEFKKLLGCASAELLPRYDCYFWRTTSFSRAELGYWFFSSLAYQNVISVITNLMPLEGSDGRIILKSLDQIVFQGKGTSFMTVSPETQLYIDALKEIITILRLGIAVAHLLKPIVYGNSGLSDVNESAYVNFRRGINI